MAAVCDVCGKGPIFGKSVSHSHVRTNRRWNPNIQRVRALVGGAPKHLNMCTSCLKAGNLLKNAPIILLDEATASLDPENEIFIQQAIQELVKDNS